MLISLITPLYMKAVPVTSRLCVIKVRFWAIFRQVKFHENVPFLAINKCKKSLGRGTTPSQRPAPVGRGH